MDKFKKKNSKFAFALTTVFFLALIAGILYIGKDSSHLIAAESNNHASVVPISEKLRAAINSSFKDAKEWPSSISYDGGKADIHYSFNTQLDDYIQGLLRKYGSDYSTVVVMDNETGEILSAVGYEGRSRRFNSNLVLTSTHPSASLIKMITAADVIENTEVTKDTLFRFKGRSTTLFKYQVQPSKNNKWENTQSFEMAFAVSNNVIFGKAAIENSSIASLARTAEHLGFNKTYMNEFDFLKSKIVRSVEDNYHLAEVASGYTKDTVISPIHAAMIASVVANDGVLKTPRMISKVTSGDDDVLWENGLSEEKVLSAHAVTQMKDLMGATITSGTARKSFRKLKRGYKESLEIGGKTGSLTGGIPFGKRDWFAFYAKPVDATKGKGISVAIMNVNVKKWYIKSTMVAKEITEFYYRDINPIPLNYSSKKNIASNESNDDDDEDEDEVRMDKRSLSSLSAAKASFTGTKAKKIVKKKVAKAKSQKSKRNVTVTRKATVKKVAKSNSAKSRKIASEKSKKQKNSKKLIAKSKKKSQKSVVNNKKKNFKREIGKNDERKSNPTI